MKQLDQGEMAATARARLHGDMVPPRNDVQVSRPQAPRPMPPAMNPAFTYPGKSDFGNVCDKFPLFASSCRKGTCRFACFLLLLFWFCNYFPN